MEKVQVEVRGVVFEGRRNINEEDIQKLENLKAVTEESLRLHPPAALIPRESREKCEVGGFEISVEANIIINAWRDPKYWNDADCFRPERFMGSSVDFKGTDFEFLPFGGGKRMCPGMTLALASIEPTLCQLLYHFNWKLPKEMKPEELDMSESAGIICKREDDLYVIATPS